MRQLHQILFAIGAVVLFMVSTPGLVFAQAPETITDYQTNLHLERDGTLQVTENITYDFGSNQKHGIYRDIPTTVPDTAAHWYQERYLTVDHVSVTRDQHTEPFTLEEHNGVYHLTIGDPAYTISGTHTYSITYDVHGALVRFTDGSEGLYWNAVTAQWAAPIEHAVATLSAAPGILQAPAHCYAGGLGSTASCEATTTSSGDYRFVSTQGGGLTIQIRTAPHTMLYAPLTRFKAIVLQSIAGALAGLIGFCGVLWFLYLKRRNQFSTTIIAQYEPYVDPDTKQPIAPMYAGLIIDQSLDQRDISAAIIYLAAEGYITIKRTERKLAWIIPVDDHEITLVRPLPPEAEPILRKTIELLSFDNRAGETVSLSSLRSDASHRRQNAQRRLDIVSIGTTYLREHGYTESLHKILRRTQAVVFAALGGVVAIILLAILGLYVAAIVLTVSGVVMIVIAASDRLTPKGYEARNYLEGFKEFLSVTDRDRFAFHDDPAKDPQTFMKYLPYAISLGVEHKWAAVFAGLSIPQPEWYSGPDNAAFSAVALTQSLDSFSTQFASASRSPVSQSSSFGGGFAGGGAGGGGGGSW